MSIIRTAPALTGPAPRLAAGARRRLLAMLTAGLLGAMLMLPEPAAAAPAWARGVQQPLEPNSLVNKPPGISLEQAANMVRRETGGRVLSASPSERGGRRGYEIRVLVDGKRVKSYFVDGDGRVRSRD